MKNDTCYNADELWKHFAKRKKPDTKDHVLYASICVKWPDLVNP